MSYARSSLLLVAVAVAAVGATAALPAPADSTPIGPLPKGPVTSIETSRGSLVAVALPRQKPSSGLVWRVARRVDARVLAQVSEANVGSSVALVFRATGRGRAAIHFALTRGEPSGKALRSATDNVHAR
ncbi:MAG: hypothetical protein MSC30_19655 [Gaiellaceae bacterium MAG52_C11]|nr:hypothetical protein [Candidatus Gaiellasilicea maunaloa]